MRKIALFLFLVFAFGCKNEFQSFKRGSIINTSCKEIIIDKSYQTFNIDTIIKSFRYVPLETNSESLIGRIDQLVIYNNRIYILDKQISKSLFVFNITGQFISKIHKVGKGPGEYIRPDIVRLDTIKKQIIIGSIDVRKLLIYDFSGKFINEIKLKFFFRDFMITQSGFVFDLDNRSNPQGLSDNLIFIDPDGKITKGYFPFENIRPMMGSSFYECNTIPNYIKYLDNQIYSIVSNDSVLVKYTINFKNKNLNNNDIPVDFYSLFHNKIKYLNNENLINYLKNRDIAWGISRYYETSTSLFFTFSKRQQIFSVLYSKGSKNTIAFSRYIRKNNLYIYTPNVLYCYNNFYITSIETDWLIKDIDYTKNHCSKSEWQELSDSFDYLLTKNIKATDNPILLFTEFKCL